jgi:hypothetical protein
MRTWRGCAFVLLLVLVLALTDRAYSVTPPEALTIPKALLDARLDAVQRAYRESWLLYREGRSRDVDRIYLWSVRWLEAEREATTQPAERTAAYEGHRKRMRLLDDSVRARLRAGAVAPVEAPAAEFYRVEADIWLRRAKGG